MTFHIITIFPKAFESFLQTSLVARAIKKNIIKIKVHDLRNWTTDKHRSVDNRPYGGGPGMVLQVDVIDRAISALKSRIEKPTTKVILLTPQGKPFNQKIAKRLSSLKSLILIAGHYEGYDERIRDLVDEEVSIGDYVLTGGELPAMVVVDAVARNVRRFLGKEKSLAEESFSLDGRLLEYPQYTRPEVYKKNRVPKVLLSGNHSKIRIWRNVQAKKRTQARRPDLLELDS